jgi:hypothetical protein
MTQCPTDFGMVRNPFSTRFIRPGAVEFRYSDDVNRESLLDAFARHGRWGQILGCHGSGKSTLLHSLRPELERIARVRWIQVEPIDEERRWTAGRFKADRRVSIPSSSVTSERSICVIDGFDRLGWWSRRRLIGESRRSYSGLLITTHRDLGLPTLYRPGLSESEFHELVRQLLGGSVLSIAPREIREVFRRHAPNVREALFALYDRYEDCRRSCEPSEAWTGCDRRIQKTTSSEYALAERNEWTARRAPAGSSAKKD